MDTGPPKGAAHQKGGANKGDQVNILGLGGSGRATSRHRPKKLSESTLHAFEGRRSNGTLPRQQIEPVSKHDVCLGL